MKGRSREPAAAAAHDRWRGIERPYTRDDVQRLRASLRIDYTLAFGDRFRPLLLQFGLDREPEQQFFADLRQWSGGMPLFPVGTYYAVRTDGDPEAIIATVRGIVREVDSAATMFYVARMDTLVASTISRPRMYAALLGIFAGVGVVLAVIGIYGVLAYAVTQRTREIGVRMALGAQHGEVMSLVLRQGLALATVGIALGLAGASAATRYLEGMLFGLTPLDRTTFAGVALLFAAVAASAAYVPARRATRVDPLTALRCE